MSEAANWHLLRHALPTHVRHELLKHHLQRDAIQRIQWSSSCHREKRQEVQREEETRMKQSR